MSSSSNSSLDSSAVLLGSVGSTISVASGWQQFLFSFFAPTNAALLPYLMFNPTATAAGWPGSAYPGLDNVSLTMAAPTGVPEPCTPLLLGSGLAGVGGLGFIRRKFAI